MATYDFTRAHEVLPLRSATANTQHSEDTITCFIDSLPFEILSEIFCCSLKLASEPNGFHTYVTSLSLASPPLNLISVCKFWRAVALTTTSLWDSIFPLLNSISCIKAWMKISSYLPFHLMLSQLPNESTLTNSGNVCELFQLFSTISHRWKSLSIRISAGLAEEFLKLLQASAGNPIPIKDLYVSLASSDVPGATMSGILSLLPVSTSVERLYWDGRFEKSTSLFLPWEKLRTIDVKLPSTAQDAVDILSKCTSASVVSIYMFPTRPLYDQMPILHHDPPFLLPLLISLTLSRRTDPMALFQYFTFPSLRYLFIQVAHRDLFSFANFLKRTPLLEQLIIDESGKDIRNSPDGPSERDIVDYLAIPELRRIPSFKLTFRNAHSVTRNIIEGNPNVWTPQDLLCWRECSIVLRYTESSFIGWGKHWCIEQLIWTCRQGQIEFTPEYHLKWYNWKDRSLFQ